jgi:DNA-binding NtrC family response regulator
VLVLDPERPVHLDIELLLAGARFHVACVASAAEALRLVDRRFFAVALIDIDTPAPDAGLGMIRRVKQMSPTSMVIAMTSRPSYDLAVDAVRAGAIDLLPKPPASAAHLKDRVLDAAHRSLARRRVDAVLADVRGVHEDLLQSLMESDRRALDLADQAAGRDPLCTIDPGHLRILVIDEANHLAGAMAGAGPGGFELVHATSGGEGLDRLGSDIFHYALIAEQVTDLPARMLARAIHDQHPDTVVLTFVGPAVHGKIELVEATGTRVLVKPFSDVQLLLARIDQLAEAWPAKARVRRYTRAFREKHAHLLRRYVQLRAGIERVLREGPG